MAQPSDWVDGQFLVLADRTALPPRCIHTNQPVSERECEIFNLPWIEPTLKLAMCFVPALLLIAPYAIKRRCRVQVGISRSVRRNYLLRKVAAGLVMLGALVTPFVLLASNWTGPLIIVFALAPFTFWGCFVYLVLFSSPLTIANHKGHHFWLQGCSPEFLASIRADLRAAAQAPVA
jgi:hypothetical protein